MKAIIDMHTHTVASGHAYSTIHENIQFAKKHGMKFLGTSDHGSTMTGGPAEYFFHNLKVVPREMDGVKILRGMEANILDVNGNIDELDSKALDGLDYLIASLHIVCIEPSTKEDNTMAILNVMDKEKVKIIGHPDDARYELDYEAIVKKAKEKNILLEVNNSSLSPNTSREGARENILKYLELCKEYGVRIIMGTDSHICYDIGVFQYAEAIIEEANFPKELVINYWEDQIIEFFGI
ncbi:MULTISPECIES: phosphatase [Clostridia]|jgi:putative hydrolase|uniref:phosphatase n=1 Tax=Clostridia TaxID=186801 RepID=UPI0018A9F7BD|nr:phosphatase [Clostridium sp. 1001270J_160509_D11]